MLFTCVYNIIHIEGRSDNEEEHASAKPVSKSLYNLFIHAYYILQSGCNKTTGHDVTGTTTIASKNNLHGYYMCEYIWFTQWKGTNSNDVEFNHDHTGTDDSEGRYTYIVLIYLTCVTF